MKLLAKQAAVALSALVITASSMALSAPSTLASNFFSNTCVGSAPPRNCVSFADNGDHSWYPEGTLGNQIAGIDGVVQEVMDDYENYSDVVTTKKNHDTLDVLVTDWDYPEWPDVAGWVECLDYVNGTPAHPNAQCDRAKLRFNESFVQAINTRADSKAVACHEIGHTFGLRHTFATDTCMEGFWHEDMRTLTSVHDDAHLNARY